MRLSEADNPRLSGAATPEAPSYLVDGTTVMSWLNTRDHKRIAAEQGCLKCHSTDGTRHIGPTWLDLYHRREKLSDGSFVDADEAYLTESMMDPALKVVDGFQPVMPSFQGKISGPEVAALVEYIKSLQSDAVRTGPSEGPAYAPVRGR